MQNIGTVGLQNHGIPIRNLHYIRRIAVQQRGMVTKKLWWSVETNIVNTEMDVLEVNPIAPAASVPHTEHLYTMAAGNATSQRQTVHTS